MNKYKIEDKSRLKHLSSHTNMIFLFFSYSPQALTLKIMSYPVVFAYKHKISENLSHTSLLIWNTVSVEVKFSSNILLHNIIDYTTSFFKDFVFRDKLA